MLDWLHLMFSRDRHEIEQDARVVVLEGRAAEAVEAANGAIKRVADDYRRAEQDRRGKGVRKPQ